MKKTFIVLAVMGFVMSSCDQDRPTDYFGQAALNCNLLYGFAGSSLARELEQPSEKLVNEKTMETAPMKRVEIIQTKIDLVEANLKKINALGNNEEAAEMVDASKQLHEFVLPVYKNDYMQLAILYDKGKPKDQVEAAKKK